MSTDGFSPSLSPIVKYSVVIFIIVLSQVIFIILKPIRDDMADYNDQRGFHIFDTETLDTEFIPNPFSMFHKIYYDDSEDKNQNRIYQSTKIVMSKSSSRIRPINICLKL